MAERLGLIAGSGRFPVLVAEEARRQGVEVFALGIPGVTDPAVESKVAGMEYFKLGQLEAPIRFLKSRRISKAVMAGKVQHASLFGGVMPDFRAVKLFARLKDRRVDTILGAVAEEFSKEGIELLPSSAYLTHLIPSEGVLTRREPTKEERCDVELGWRAAKAVAGFDIGQAVVAQGGAIIAVEAMEGTDAAVARAGEIARSHGRRPRLVVVKVAKPNQDFRFDLPVLGLDTLPVLEKAGASVLALEAGKTLIFDREEFIRRADALGLTILAVSEESAAKGPRT